MSGDVADVATGVIRIMRTRCTTCIMRSPRDGQIQLEPSRIAAFIQSVGDAGGYVVCHNTMHQDEGAMCRGYTDAYGLPIDVRLALAAGAGRLVEVDEPEAD